MGQKYIRTDLDDQLSNSIAYTSKTTTVGHFGLLSSQSTLWHWPGHLIVMLVTTVAISIAQYLTNMAEHIAL